MITRNIPFISQFPEFNTITSLSAKFLDLKEFRPIFYDIETTGLSAAKSYCYLIGCIVFDEGQFHLHQWFAENESEEKLILQSFFDFSASYNYTIQYNGDAFDQPYLKKRCESYNMPFLLETLPSMDLYKILKPCKSMLKLEHMKQPDLEEFLLSERRLFADGKICIKCYKNYLKKKDSELLAEVLGHNLEDLYGLGQIYQMLAYRLLYIGDYTVKNCTVTPKDCLFQFELPLPIPKPFSCGKEGIYLTGQDCCIKLLVASKNNCLKMYYPNYKDYAYLPSEDTAIPKSLSSYLDKSLKKPAKPETCYTWFEVTEDFLNDKQQQHKYLTHLLEFFLMHLE